MENKFETNNWFVIRYPGKSTNSFVFIKRDFNCVGFHSDGRWSGGEWIWSKDFRDIRRYATREEILKILTKEAKKRHDIKKEDIIMLSKEGSLWVNENCVFKNAEWI